MEKIHLFNGTHLAKAALKLLGQLMNYQQHLVSSDKFNIRILFKQVKINLKLVKKLKSLDVPDLLQAVKGKKLPKEALRGVLGRFKLEG